MSFTYTIYKSVKSLQGIGSSFWPYVPKRAFHMVWISSAILWLWQARHRSLAVASSSEIGGMIMTLFQKCLLMSNPGWAPDQPMDYILHLSTAALFAYPFLPFPEIVGTHLHDSKNSAYTTTWDWVNTVNPMLFTQSHVVT